MERLREEQGLPSVQRPHELEEEEHRLLQRLEADEVGEASERLQEAGRDRRGGWRASKAKGVRRNRRYEKRLLRGVGDELFGDEF